MIIIDDSFISEDYVAMTQEAILSDTRPIFWTLNQQTNVPDEESVYAVPDKNTQSAVQFVSHVDKNHPLYNGIFGIFNSFVKKHGIDFAEIVRIKINLIQPGPNPDASKYHMPHVDSDSEHKVFIYYVNDSDGDTIFFNQVADGHKPEKFTVMNRVSPKRGRGVVFDGSIYHASSSPIENQYRCIINIDFV
jgi:hypothetical protein